MNKLHNALKTLNLTLEQRNELVKVLSEIGGGGEWLEFGINMTTTPMEAHIILNGYTFPISINNYGVDCVKEFNKHDILTALNIKDVEECFKYSYVNFTAKENGYNSLEYKSNVFFEVYQTVDNNDDLINRLEIGVMMNFKIINYITISLYANLNKGEIRINFSKID